MGSDVRSDIRPVSCSVDELPTPVIAGLPELDEQPERPPACAELAHDTADIVVRVAEHAAHQAGGIPGEVFAAEHADIWQLADRLAVVCV